MNPHLALAISKAKKLGFPKASIEATIARGQGLSTSGAKLEAYTIEVMIPPSIAAIVNIQTDNKGRTLHDVRGIIKDHKGQITPSAYLFDRKGLIVFKAKDGMSLDDLMDLAIDAGALDIDEGEDGMFEVYTEPSATKAVSDSLEAALKLEMESLDIIYDPKESVRLDSAVEEENLAGMIRRLKDIPGVQDIFVNAN